MRMAWEGGEADYRTVGTSDAAKTGRHDRAHLPQHGGDQHPSVSAAGARRAQRGAHPLRPDGSNGSGANEMRAVVDIVGHGLVAELEPPRRSPAMLPRSASSVSRPTAACSHSSSTPRCTRTEAAFLSIFSSIRARTAHLPGTPIKVLLRDDDGNDEGKARAQAEAKAAPLIKQHRIGEAGVRVESKPSMALDEIGIYQMSPEPLATGTGGCAARRPQGAARRCIAPAGQYHVRWRRRHRQHPAKSRCQASS